MPTELIQVLFAVPAEIAEGLRSRELVRRGGVIQEAGTKAVKLWLKEATVEFPDAASVPPQIAEQLRSLQMTSSALLVGQALTLGVTVAGFAILAHRIGALDEKVGVMLTTLKEVGRDVSWLDRRADVAIEARLRGALNQAQWAVETGRLEALVHVRSVLVEVEHHYRGLLTGMLDTQRAHEHAALYAAYHGHLALAGVARAQCDERMDGLAAGAKSMESTASTLAAMDEQFREPLRSVLSNRHLMRLPQDQDQFLREALAATRETTHRVQGKASVRSFFAENELPLSDLDGLGADGPDEPHLVFLRPTAKSK